MKKFVVAIMSVFLFANIANAIELKGVWIAFSQLLILKNNGLE